MENYTLISPETSFIDPSARIGAGAVIGPGCTVGEGCVIGEGAVLQAHNVVLRSRVGAGAVLYPGNFVQDSEIGAGARLYSSVAEGASVGENASVGPFAHLRAGSAVGRGCRVGNFVELKNCTLGEGTKVAHLTYIGDASLGKRCNVGCGVVFCNYDGRAKHRTEVGDGCFIGSNVNLVAPLALGAGCFIAAGTTVTRSVPAGAFVIGRARQQQSEALAARYLRGEWDGR